MEIREHRKYAPNRLKSYDDKSIIEEIRRVVDEHFRGSTPNSNDFDRYSRVKSWTIRKRFGSWANALQKAGFRYGGFNYANVDLSRSKYTKDQMKEDLLRIRDLNQGEYFTYDFYKSNGGRYNIKTLKKHLGHTDWRELLEGVLSLRKPLPIQIIRTTRKGKRKSLFTEGQLFSEMKRVWDVLGRRPSYSEFRRYGNIGTKVYERRFGTWKKAIESFCLGFGYNIQGTGGVAATHEMLLAELKNIASKIKSDVLTFKRYKKEGGTYSVVTFQNYFGSWENAVQGVGLNDGHSGRYSTEELFTELQHLWEMLGKQPRYKDMNKYGKISGRAFQNKFGSWMKAIYAFCEDCEAEHRENVEKEDIEIERCTSPNEIVAKTSADSEAERALLGETSIVMITPRQPSLRLRFLVLRRDNFKCRYCGKSPATHPNLELQVDHVVPYSEGGETVLENLQTLCRECNLGKSSLAPN